MHQDLQLLIQLQDLDLAADRDRRQIADIPAAQQSLDTRIAGRTADLDVVKERVAAVQAARRDIEKDLAAVQARLSKFKGQLMDVKTNKEYQAMQKEMAAAEVEIRAQEDKLLERMEEGDTLAAQLKTAEAALKAERAEVASEQKALDVRRVDLEKDLARLTAERAGLTPKISRDALVIFERVALGRRGVAVAEARGGLCTVCHVRMRPQTFNEVRRNDGLHQCESCTRILFFVPASPQAV